MSKCLTRFRVPWRWDGGASDTSEPSHRRYRLCPAKPRGAPQIARWPVLLSLQCNSELERRGRRRGDQCWIGSPPPRSSPRRWPRASSTRPSATVSGERRRPGIAGWDIDISPDGAGLPPGHGDVGEGEAIFAAKCAGCHGAHGEGKPMDRLVGGFGTVFEVKPERTVGSYWPYATTLFDFVRRAMPFDAPQSLTPEQVYAVCAYVLFLNGIVPQGRHARRRAISPRSECPTATASSAPIRHRKPSENARPCGRNFDRWCFWDFLSLIRHDS